MKIFTILWIFYWFFLGFIRQIQKPFKNPQEKLDILLLWFFCPFLQIQFFGIPKYFFVTLTKKVVFLPRKVARVVDRGRLEICWTLRSSGGSNPSLSAKRWCSNFVSSLFIYITDNFELFSSEFFHSIFLFVLKISSLSKSINLFLFAN